MGHEAHSWETKQDWFGAHMQLAKLYIGRHETPKDPTTLGALLGIWKGANPVLPLIKEAISLHQILMKEID